MVPLGTTWRGMAWALLFLCPPEETSYRLPPNRQQDAVFCTFGESQLQEQRGFLTHGTIFRGGGGTSFSLLWPQRLLPWFRGSGHPGAEKSLPQSPPQVQNFWRGSNQKKTT